MEFGRSMCGCECLLCVCFTDHKNPHYALERGRCCVPTTKSKTKPRKKKEKCRRRKCGDTLPPTMLVFSFRFLKYKPLLLQIDFVGGWLVSSCAPRRRHPPLPSFVCIVLRGKLLKFWLLSFILEPTHRRHQTAHIYLRSFMIFWLIVCRVPCGFIAHRHSLSMLVARSRKKF